MYRSRVSIVLLCAFLFTAIAYWDAGAKESIKEPEAVEPFSKPLIVYYSRSGTTRTIAQELSRNLSCEIEEIISQKNRRFWGILTCVHDQLFDRDDNIKPIKKIYLAIIHLL